MASRRFPSLSFILIAALLLLSPFTALQVRAQDDADDFEDEVDGLGADAEPEGEGFDGGPGDGATEVVSSGEDVEEAPEEFQLLPAPGVDTVYLFPGFVSKQPVVRAGQQAELLFGIDNQASGPLKISGVLARLFLSYDYRVVAQNFTGELPSNVTFLNASVPNGAQSTFSFRFTPYKYLQPMSFGLAATVFYELDGAQHASVLYNSTVEIVEPAGMVSGETVFLVLLGAGLLTLLAMWVSSQLDAFSKRAKRSKKVETGTDGADSADNEWLKGTNFPQQRKAAASAAAKPKRR